MPRLTLCLTIVVLALGTAGATAQRPAQPLDEPLSADLDGDGVGEIVRARETACFGSEGELAPPCPPSVDLRTLVVEVVDPCAGGERVLRLSREMEYVSVGELVDADRDGRPRELVFELRAGAAARAVQAKIVAFRAGPDGCVAVRRTLFSYPRADTVGARPKGTFFSTGSILLRDFSKRYSGRELRTLESYGRATDPGCCPSYSRTTFWRYVKARSRYEPFRTKLTRLR
ncbi:MAG: hypothetical protein QOE31_243 [Solirubrobacteraceae bacterium]|nr:hypothetical protein [Solirubrobacteraceae bacterium]